MPEELRCGGETAEFLASCDEASEGSTGAFGERDTGAVGLRVHGSEWQHRRNESDAQPSDSAGGVHQNSPDSVCRMLSVRTRDVKSHHGLLITPLMLSFLPFRDSSLVFAVDFRLPNLRVENDSNSN
jgi:hypothetical protein